MSVIYYVVRQKKNTNKYYRRREGNKAGGWIDGPETASVWSTYQGPHQVIAQVGKDHAEIVPLTVLFQPGEYNTVYCVRNKITGQYVANKKHRNRGIFYSDRWDDAGLWTRVHHAKSLIRTWVPYCKHPSMLKYNLDIKAEELEIVKMPIFVPPMETI